MSRKARILFVDDEKRVLNSMQGMFRREYDLYLATDGQAAIDIASQTPLDVIVTDQRMPGMSGIEVLEKVKELSPRTIRILLTGYADPAAVESSINIGEVFRFLGKPCTPKILRDTLDLASKAAQVASEPARSAPAEPESERTDRNDSRLPIVKSAALTKLPTLSPGIHPTQTSKRKDVGQPKVLAKEVGVILYTVDPRFAETAIRAVSADRRTTLATSLVKVMQAMKQEHTGVLVTDVSSSDTRLQGIIAELKHYVPELVTIVVSDSRDSTDMINLINCGQIYRYLVKPVTPTQLRADIGSAAAKHVDLRSNRASTRRHAVEQHPVRHELPTTDIGTMSRMREVRSRQLSTDGRF